MTTQQLLWNRWGSPEFPAEWDGREGGGRGSQRFWEYLWTLNHIGDHRNIVDAGGGNEFLAGILRDSGISTTVVDPLAKEADGNYLMTLEEFVKLGAEPDLVISVSVLEHVDDKQAFCAALDSFNCPILLTYEFGEGCITMAQTYEFLKAFQRHYLTSMELCPVVADNSDLSKWRPMAMILDL